MFMGEYSHTIDAKGRLIIPSKFREALGEEFVVTKGLDGCLFVYDQTEWSAFEELNDNVVALSQQTKERDIQRFGAIFSKNNAVLVIAVEMFYKRVAAILHDFCAR